MDNQELIRATPERGSLAAHDPNYDAGSHHFSKGNTLGATRPRQKIANVLYQRALDVLSGAEPEPLDTKNPLLHLVSDMIDPNLDRGLRQSASDKLCRYIFGTKSNLNLELGNDDGGEASAGVRRLAFALGMVKEN